MLPTKSKRNVKPTRGKAALAEPPIVPPRRVIIPRPDVLHNYLDHKQICQYMDYLCNRYPHFVRSYTLGLTHERREVRALEINWMNSANVELSQQLRQHSPPQVYLPANSKTPCPVVIKGEQCRNTIFIEAGTHAREWIGVTTALNCIYQLTERHTRNIEVLRKLRFIIVPLVNPDGYEYSRNKNPNWRKNRRPHKSTKFVGTDCNRNYDIFWNSGTGKMNRNTYKGERPFSEPETRALRSMLDRLGPNLLFFLSLHSYGQSIMYPWGYSRDPPLFWRELSTLANSGKCAIKSYNGREYRTGSISCLTKRTIAGSVVDYVYGVLRVPMALVMELPSRDLGFQPPVEMISQIGHESWYGIREMCKRAYDLRHQIQRETEPALPAAAIYQAGAGDGAGNEVVAMESKPAAAATANTDEPQQATPKKPKKRVKRSVRAQHEYILKLQKSSKAAAAGARLHPRQMPKVASAPPARLPGAHGDGPKLPLGVFL
ncbi:carboxypeptidase B [Drosophila guanche]|uniref:Blast:Carboxypeptidase B n=1 Tax=Drosophila guanche TaxID=7266 RepID=A0A3B0JU10_DROGU|nr:carboxypeptidase B [Drosophila guanche]SPP77179.1 blast:Carboxypeptidase B [Drosophila guanche]